MLKRWLWISKGNCSERRQRKNESNKDLKKPDSRKPNVWPSEKEKLKWLHRHALLLIIKTSWQLERPLKTR